jgi:hypothetical protein
MRICRSIWSRGITLVTGLEVKRNWEECTISLSQHSYINSILCHFCFKESKPLSTSQNPTTTA